MKTGIPILAASLALTVFLSALVLESLESGASRASLGSGEIEVLSRGLELSMESLSETGAALKADGPEDPVEALLHQARQFRAAKNIHGSFELYRAVLKHEPHHPEALLSLGTFSLLLGHEQDAEGHFLALIREVPALEMVARRHLAYAQLRQRKLGPAEENLHMVLGAEPRDGVAHFEMACVCAVLSETDRALQHLEHAYDALGPDMVRYVADPHLDTVRHAARFKRLLRLARADAAKRDEASASPASR